MTLTPTMTLKEIYDICYKESPCEECRFGIIEDGHDYAECIFALESPSFWIFKKEEE